MPTFGDFETYGEPIAITEERGHVSTVWRATKGGKGDSKFIVKCYAPPRSTSKHGQSEDALERDPAHEFLEGIKQLKKAHSERGPGLVPIHDFGISDLGAWYVTDFYPRNSLKAWIAKRGSVDSAGLRQVVHGVVGGCLTLVRSRGYSHGNLKPSNVFLSGKPQPLRNTPLHLADAYPAAPLQLARLRATDKRTVGELLGQVMEVQDLRALGELLLQLVEGRLVTSAYDYNYPVAASTAWENLGRDGERWRELCNQLLDPQLSLDKVNLESLAKEYKAGAGAGIFLFVLGVVGGLCLLGGGIYGGYVWSQSRTETGCRMDLQAATNALERSEFIEARVKVASALTKKPGDKNATDFQKQIEVRIDLEYANVLKDADNFRKERKFKEALEEIEKLEKLKPDDKRGADLAKQIAKDQADTNSATVQEAKRTQLKKLLADGQSASSNANWIQATNLFGQARSLAAELKDAPQGDAARAGLNKATEEMAGMTVRERLRSDAIGLIASGKAAVATNGWREATNMFTQARTLAEKLPDDALVKQASDELAKAQAGLAKFLSEEEDRRQIRVWLSDAKVAESSDWNSALNLYTKVLTQANELKDESLKKEAQAGIDRAKNGLLAQASKVRLQKEVEDLLKSGADALVAKDWQKATSDFDAASRKASDLQNSDLINRSNQGVAKAKKGFDQWNVEQKLRSEAEDSLKQAQDAMRSQNWSSATNLYAQAIVKAKLLGDSKLEGDANQGLLSVLGKIKAETEQTNLKGQIDSLLALGKKAAEKPDWITATNFFGQAVSLGAKLTDFTLRKSAEKELQNAEKQLAAQIAEANEKRDLVLATSSIAKGDYEEARKLCQKYPNSKSLSALVAQIQNEQSALTAAEKKFSEGDYSFITELAGHEYKAKPPFDALQRKGAEEQVELGKLNDLKQAANWQALLKKLPLPTAFSGKPPFDDLRKWAERERGLEEERNRAAIAKLDTNLETLRKQLLGGKKPQWMSVPESTEKKITTEMGADSKTWYAGEISRIEKSCGGVTDKNDKNRQDLIKDLRDNLKNRD